MPQAETTKLYRTFVKGLITEASPLTFPDDASIEEDNCVIFRKGNRTRRLGADLEENWVTFGGISEPNVALKEYRWESPDEQSNLNFLVQQIGDNLFFWDLGPETTSTARKSFNINLNTFKTAAATSLDVFETEVSFASGKGYLFVCGAKIEPFIVEYDFDTDTITTSQVYIQIRDFKGVDDQLANDEEPSVLSNEHHYNLRNQGWVAPSGDGGSIGSAVYYGAFGGIGDYGIQSSKPITDFQAALGRYPGNNKQWWVARATADGDGLKVGDFAPKILDKTFFGNARAPRGHHILNAFFKDRSAVSGVPGLTPEEIKERPVSVAFFSGRAWWLCNDTVYYSQILDDKSKAGRCYQEADPTSEAISDLIASDGGVVPIPEMSKGSRLVAIGNGVMAISPNGVWTVQGTSNGFSASDITVSNLSKVGCESPNSIVEADGSVYWWSKVGIMSFSQKSGMFGPIEGAFDRANISELTVQSFFFNEVSDSARPYVKGLFDPSTNVIQWLFKSEGVGYRYLYDRALNLDLTLQAFYPWSVSGTNNYICGSFLGPRINSIQTSEDVVDNGVQVQASGDDVVTNVYNLGIRESFIRYSVLSRLAPTSYGITFGGFTNTNYADWQAYDSVGSAYNSYVIAGYELLGDAMRKKQIPYLFCYFRRTEENFLPLDGDYTVDRPSSCRLQVRWDWSNSEVSNKFSSEVEAYRHRRLPFVNELDPVFNTGSSVVVSRNRVRGTGRAIQFKFSCNEIGKDFDLLGWQVAFTGNTKP